MRILQFVTVSLFFSLIACSSNEDTVADASMDNSNEIELKYTAYLNATKVQINTTMDIVSGQTSRSNADVTGSELINYLISLPQETLDSLYSLYCTPQEAEKFEESYDIIYETMTANTSVYDVQSVYSFSQSYIERGGNDLKFVANCCSKATPIVQDCIINNAAKIDSYVQIAQEGSHLKANSYCLQQLTLELAQSTVENAITDVIMESFAGIPAVDVAAALILAGYDLYSSIKMAHNYNKCLINHLS